MTSHIYTQFIKSHSFLGSIVFLYISTFHLTQLQFCHHDPNECVKNLNENDFDRDSGAAEQSKVDEHHHLWNDAEHSNEKSKSWPGKTK